VTELPLDYLNGVLPTAQFGSESVVSLSGKDMKTSSDSNSWVSASSPLSASSIDFINWSSSVKNKFRSRIKHRQIADRYKFNI
jgi:hypothetical protein